MKSIKYRADIDALRGISILVVVIYHAFPSFLPGGFVGVDIFFVISGYLITTIIYKEIKSNNFSFVAFYDRRIKRIFPALITVLVFCLIIGFLVLFPDEYQQLGKHVTYVSIFIQNFLLINELGYFDVSSNYKPLLHLWTLSIEEQYYLFWPLLLLLIFKVNRHLLSLTIAIVITSFVANIYFVSSYKEVAFFHSLTRFWELGVGSVLAIYLMDKNYQISEKFSSTIFFIGSWLIFLSIFIINEKKLYPYWYALMPTIGATLVILANVKRERWYGLVKLGLISYPLYLWHWVIFSFLYIYIGKQPSSIVLMGAILLSLIFAYLTFKYIEKVRYLQSYKVSGFLILLMAIIGLTSLLIEKESGLPNREHLGYLSKYNLEFKRSPAVDKQCELYIKSITQKNRKVDYCRSNLMNENEKTIVIIGDSHGHVLFPGIAKAALKHGYNTILLANSSCPPLEGFLWGRNSSEIKICQEKIRQIIDILQTDKKIRKVFFTTRGPIYIHGNAEKPFTKETIEQSLKHFKDKQRYTYQTYFSGFNKTLTQISAVSHINNIYYMLENPELDFLPKEIMPRPFDVFGVSTQSATISTALYKERMNEYQQNVYNSAQNYPKLQILDLAPYLCDKMLCYAFKKGNFLYADSDHFSIFGSYYVAQVLDKVVFRAD